MPSRLFKSQLAEGLLQVVELCCKHFTSLEMPVMHMTYDTEMPRKLSDSTHSFQLNEQQCQECLAQNCRKRADAHMNPFNANRSESGIFFDESDVERVE